MTTLGFLGLGTMGLAMARRLLSTGNDLLVWNRSPTPVKEVCAEGARAAASPTEALSADISFSMLANDEAVLSVFDDDAIAVVRGRTHVMTASISPALADRLAERFASAGAGFVMAPVLGRAPVAAEGKLNILAAGQASAIDAVSPYLEQLAVRVWRLGDVPSVASAVKVALNYTLIHAMQAIGESVAMTERLGVDPELFAELLRSTFFAGTAYSVYGDIIARRAYSPPGFRMPLGRKDLRLAEELAAASGVVPATLPALIAVFERALADDELKDVDWSAIAEVTRRDLLS